MDRAFGRDGTSPVHGLYDLSLSHADWAAAATRLLLPELGGDGPGRFVALETGSFDALAVDASDDEGNRMAAEFPVFAPRNLHARMARCVLTSVTRAGLMTEATRGFLAELRAKEAVAVSCMDERGGLVVGRLVGEGGRPPRVNVQRIPPLARAIRLAYRARVAASALQTRFAAPAVLTSEGALVARDRAAVPERALEVLRRAVRARESARRDATQNGDPVSPWSNLVAGRWSLLDDYEEGGRRYVLALTTGPGERRRVKLVPNEARALELCIQGRPVKSVAAELGAPTSTVYALRNRALSKLGARSEADLVALARATPGAVLTRFECGAETLVAIGLPSVCAEGLAGLTPSERAILSLVLAAKRHTEIARNRETSPRTIANQIASIYRKLGVSSRAELAARIRRNKA